MVPLFSLKHLKRISLYQTLKEKAKLAHMEMSASSCAGAAQADVGQAEEGALAEANSEASTSEANSFVKSEPQVSSHQSQQHLARGPVKTLEASNRCFKESVEGTLRSRLLGASSPLGVHIDTGFFSFNFL